MAEKLSTRLKARAINLENTHYGTFAEIGAGQEVARHFFQAGHASNTVAKTMSAYDKTFSDAIYGQGSRFVSKDRLEKMLSHEYALLEERLADKCNEKAFFTFANTVATSSHGDVSFCHGWFGLRFQKTPTSKPCDIILHVKMLDRMRLQQQEALGILGVNLIHAAFLKENNPKNFVKQLSENLGTDRLEINHILICGDEDIEYLDSKLLSLELVQNGLTKAVMFAADGTTLSSADELYKKSILVQRGTFRPVTETNVQIIEKGIEQMCTNHSLKKEDVTVIMEISMSNLLAEGLVDPQDFIDRVDTLAALGYRVMVSNYSLYSDLKQYLRQHTDQPISIVIGAQTLDKLFDGQFYTRYQGGLLGAFSNLFDEKTQLLVYPFKTELSCTTAETYSPDPRYGHLYKHFTESNQIMDISGCDDVDTSIQSEDVRKMLSQSNPKWEKLVPEKSRDIIKKRELFGYKAS